MLPQRTSRHIFLREALSDIGKVNKGQIMSIAVSFVVATVTAAYLKQPDILKFLGALVGSYLIINTVLFIAYYLSAPRRFLAQERAENARLRHEVVQLAQELRIKQPSLIARIREVHIVPIHRQAAHCFVSLTVFNSSVVPTKVQDYRMQLLIEGKEYEGELESVSGYVITDNNGWDDDAQYFWAETNREELTDLCAEIKTGPPLVKGPHTEGWLHFRFNRLPAWPEHKEVLGTGQAGYDEEGEGYEIMETYVYYQTHTATGVRLILMDSSGVEHSSPVSFPKCKASHFVKKASLPKTVSMRDYLL